MIDLKCIENVKLMCSIVRMLYVYIGLKALTMCNFGKYLVIPNGYILFFDNFKYLYE